MPSRYNYPHGYCPERGSVLKHILVAEKAFGGRLPTGAVVHHVDENLRNFSNKNLVICPDEAYHNLLHIRQRAYDACGNYSWRKCYICKEHDSPENLTPLNDRKRGVHGFYHLICKSEYKKQLYHRRKNAGK